MRYGRALDAAISSGVRLHPHIGSSSALAGALGGCPAYNGWKANLGHLRCIIIRSRQGLSLMICKPAQALLLRIPQAAHG